MSSDTLTIYIDGVEHATVPLRDGDDVFNAEAERGALDRAYEAKESNPDSVVTIAIDTDTTTEQDRFLSRMEDAWYDRTKGELSLTGDEDDIDSELVNTVLNLYANISEFVSSFDVETTDFDRARANPEWSREEADHRVIADRIAAALQICWYGEQA